MGFFFIYFWKLLLALLIHLLYSIHNCEIQKRKDNMNFKISDYENIQKLRKKEKLKRLKNLIAQIESIPASELVAKWDEEAKRIWKNGYNYSNVDESSIRLGNIANRETLRSIEANDWGVYGNY